MNHGSSENEQRSGGQEERALILWHSYLTGDPSQLDGMTRMVRRVFKHLPTAPRCLVCNAPFKGVGSAFVKILGFRAGRSSFNPTLCGRCEVIVKRYQVGIGVHTGIGYVGAVGSDQSVSDITVLGDVANTTARLASQAGAGEILVSEDTCRAAGLGLDNSETRELQLKGRSQAVTARVIHE